MANTTLDCCCSLKSGGLAKIKRRWAHVFELGKLTHKANSAFARGVESWWKRHGYAFLCCICL